MVLSLRKKNLLDSFCSHDQECEEHLISVIDKNLSSYCSSVPSAIRVTFEVLDVDTLLTSEQNQSFAFIANSAAKYLSSILETKWPLQFPLPVNNTHNISNSDFHISIYFSREMKSVASSYPCSIAIGTHPWHGIITFNIDYIPKSIDLDEIHQEAAFLTFIHECFHLLGFSKRLFQFWLNNESQPYKNDFPLFNISIRNKTRTYISTSGLKKWSTIRFGQQSLFLNHSYGLELESEGGNGTVLSHPEMSTYFNDVMVGMRTENRIVSELTLVALRDTGWFLIHPKNVGRLSYGYGPSFGSEPLSNFPFLVPRSQYP